MNDVPAWFDRTFAFPYPVELLPLVRVRLLGTAARLDEAVRWSTHETLTAKPQGKWSAQEHAGHLVDLESLWLNRLGDFVAGRDRLTPADLTNQRTDEADYNARPLQQILRDFRAAREHFVQCVSALDASRMAQALPHPRLKTPMRLADHLFFVAEHDDHHLARIHALLNVRAQRALRLRGGGSAAARESA